MSMCWCRCRICRAPGETVLGGDYALLPGGKGANQALAARRAGAAVTMAGAVGEMGSPTIGARACCAATGSIWASSRGRPADRLRRDHRRRGGENLIAVASGANHAGAAAQVPDRLLGPRHRAGAARCEVPAAENAALIRRARVRGARIVLNLAPAVPLAPARARRHRFPDRQRGRGGDPWRRSGGSRRSCGKRWWSRGARRAPSAHLADGTATGRFRRWRSMPVDTTGAGDTFAGVLAAGLDRGLAARAGAAPRQRRGRPGLPRASARRRRCPTAPRSTRRSARLTARDAREIRRAPRRRSRA